MVHSKDIDVINSLIEVTIDSANGYRKAAEVTDNSRFRDLFVSRADERQRLAMTMQEFVRSQGGNPVDGGSFAATAHRFFVDLHTKLTGRDDEAVVSDVEAGEDYIKAQFEEASHNTDVTPAAKTLIESGKRIVLAGHDQMRDIKHAMQRADDHR